jgi:hypothetical protein
MRRLLHLALFLVLATPAYAAWSRVGSCTAPNYFSSGSASATRSATTVGNLISVGGLNWGDGAQTPITVSDTLGFFASSAMLNVSSTGGNGTNIGQAWAIATSTSSNTYTTTASNGVASSIIVCEYTTTGTITADGAGVTASTSTTASNTLTLTKIAAASGELGIAYIGANNGTQFNNTLPSGWTVNAQSEFDVMTEIDNTSISSGSNSVLITLNFSGTDYLVGTMQFMTNTSSPSIKTMPPAVY